MGLPPPFEYGRFSEKSLVLLSGRVDRAAEGKMRMDGFIKEKEWSWRWRESGGRTRQRGWKETEERMEEIRTDEKGSLGDREWCAKTLFLGNVATLVSCKTVGSRSTAFSKDQGHFLSLQVFNFYFFECRGDLQGWNKTAHFPCFSCHTASYTIAHLFSHRTQAKSASCGVRQMWVRILAFLLANLVILSVLYNLSEPVSSCVLGR